MQKPPLQDQASKAQSSATKSRSTVMSNPLQPLASNLVGQIAELEQRANHAFKVLRLVRAALPEPEKSHVVSAAYRDETLTISVDSAAWTAHVRYREAMLLRELVAAGEKPFTLLKVRVGRAAP